MSKTQLPPAALPDRAPKPLAAIPYMLLWFWVHVLRQASPDSLVRLWLASSSPQPSHIHLSEVFNKTTKYLQALARLCPDTPLSLPHRDLVLSVLSARPRSMSCVRFFSSLLEQEKIHVIESLIQTPPPTPAVAFPEPVPSWIQCLVQACLSSCAPPSLSQKVLLFYVHATTCTIPSGPLHPRAHRFFWSSLDLDTACERIIQLHELVGPCQQSQQASWCLVEKIQQVSQDWSMPSPAGSDMLASYLRRAHLLQTTMSPAPASYPLF